MQDDIQPTQSITPTKPADPSPSSTPAEVPAPSTPQVKAHSKSPKALIYVLIVIVLLGGTAYGAYKFEHSRALKTENSQIAQIGALNTRITQLNDQISSQKQSSATFNTIAVLGYSIQAASAGGVTVPVQIKNNDTVSRSITVQVTFTDKNGKTLEADTGTAKSLAAGQTQTVTVTGTSKVTDYTSVKVEVTKAV